MMVFCNFLDIKAETKKVVGVKVVPFGRLKTDDPVYALLTNLAVWIEICLHFFSE